MVQALALSPLHEVVKKPIRPLPAWYPDLLEQLEDRFKTSADPKAELAIARAEFLVMMANPNHVKIRNVLALTIQAMDHLLD